MTTATQQLLDLAAAHQGDVSDYRLGKLSGYAQNTVSAWRTGVRHMGPAAVLKFAELAGTKDVMRWQILIGCEREQGPDGDVWRALRDELTLSTKVGKPPRGGMLDSLMRSIAGKAASVLLGTVALIAHSPDAAASGIAAVAQPSSISAVLAGLYIM